MYILNYLHNDDSLEVKNNKREKTTTIEETSSSGWEREGGN